MFEMSLKLFNPVEERVRSYFHYQLTFDRQIYISVVRGTFINYIINNICWLGMSKPSIELVQMR